MFLFCHALNTDLLTLILFIIEVSLISFFRFDAIINTRDRSTLMSILPNLISIYIIVQDVIEALALCMISIYIIVQGVIEALALCMISIYIIVQGVIEALALCMISISIPLKRVPRNDLDSLT